MAAEGDGSCYSGASSSGASSLTVNPTAQEYRYVRECPEPVEVLPLEFYRSLGLPSAHSQMKIYAWFHLDSVKAEV